MVDPSARVLRIVSEKPPIPALWIDTHVGIKITKVQQGENLSSVEIERSLRLRELILDLVRSGKLLCPTSDQEEEYEAERLDTEVYAEFSRLSQGVRTNHWMAIQDAQIHRAMQAHRAGVTDLVLPWRMYFHDDPFKAMQAAKSRQFIVCVTAPKGSPIVAMRSRAKELDWRETEELRRTLVSKKRTYDAQLPLELRAFGHGMARIGRDFYANVLARRFDFENATAAKGLFQYCNWWVRLGGDMNHFYDFLLSDLVKSLPIIRIRSQLFAHLVTGNDVIKSGDSGDVRLLSTAIPLAHFVLTDKGMERRIKHLGIDREWKTKIFSMATIDRLFAELESLRGTTV